jgi:NAD(P)-dependent dehydrogenase (short-subunit alcohol dehydrogenase family)
LAEAGADVVVHVHRTPDEEIDHFKRTLAALGRQVVVIRADLSRPEASVRVAQEVLTLTERVDVLVNNAAVFFPSSFPELTVRSWQEIVHTNLTAPFALSLMLGRVMQMYGGGKIIHLGDWSGQRPLPGYLPYCVSKGGIHMLTHALAKALAPQVQVNEVALGPVLPPVAYDETARRALAHQTPLKRLGKAEDVARVVRFLAETGEFVTGATYSVDGGWLASPAGGRGTAT